VSVNFSNAVMSTPLCCPARSSFISGGFYAHETGVLNNTWPNGGAGAFNDTNTLATHLQASGYRTGLIGKYLNGYHRVYPRIPPGWSRFVETLTPLDPRKSVPWTDYHIVRGTSTPTKAGSATSRDPSTTYMTDKITQEAVDFIADVPAGKPFFLMVDHVAPHVPATAPPRDAGLYRGYQYRGRSYADVAVPENLGKRLQALPAKMLRSLRAIDRGVQQVVDTLRAHNQLDRTVVVFMSDNGFMWGEHGRWGKDLPFEEAIRVPLLVWTPGVKPRTDPTLVAANLDIPRMIERMAGIDPLGQGRDLVPLLQDPRAPWRKDLLIQGFGELDRAVGRGGYAAIRTDRYKYVEYDVGRHELYDLMADPLEVKNIVDDDAMKERVTAMAAELRARMGLTIAGTGIFKAALGTAYTSQLETKGGTAPFKWTLDSGRMPPGLTLESSGRVTGTPTEAGEWEPHIRVTGTRITRQGRRLETIVRAVKFVVGSDAGHLGAGDEAPVAGEGALDEPG
jgi:arylsulfatase A-like enzyme